MSTTIAQRFPVRGDLGKSKSRVRWHGLLDVDPTELDRAIADGWLRDGIVGWRTVVGPTPRARRRFPWRSDTVPVGPGQVLFIPKPNLVVTSGVERTQRRIAGIGGPPGPLLTVGLDDGASNPVAGTSSSSAGSTNRRLVAFDSTPVLNGLVMSYVGTVTNATVSFVMKRLFLSAAAAGTTDSAGDLYAMTNVFTMDLGGFSTFSQTFTAEATGSGS